MMSWNSAHIIFLNGPAAGKAYTVNADANGVPEPIIWIATPASNYHLDNVMSGFDKMEYERIDYRRIAQAKTGLWQYVCEGHPIYDK